MERRTATAEKTEKGRKNMIDKEMLIEVVTSTLQEYPCDGCEKTKSPYADLNGGCQRCRIEVAKVVAEIIKESWW